MDQAPVGRSGSRWSSSWARTDRAARLLALAVMLGGAGWLVNRSLQQDFAAYYTAGGAVARGLDPYLNQVATPVPGAPVWDGVAIYRHSRFLYAPLVAHLFRPLAALPYLWAKAIFTALSLAALSVTLALVVPSGRRSAAGTTLMRSPWVLGIVWPPVFLTLERGQVDLLLLAALAAAWRWRARAAVAGGLLALVVLVKPLAAGVLPVLAAGRHGRWVLATVGGIAVLLGLNIVVAGPATTAAFLTDVLPRAGRFGEGGPAEWLLPDEVVASHADALEAGLAHIGGRTYAQEVGSFRRSASIPRTLMGEGAGEIPPFALSTFVAVVLVGVAAWAARRAPRHPYGYWGGLVASVLAAPVSWAMGLVWALPILALALIPRGPGPRPAPPVPRAARRLCLLAFAAALTGPLFGAGWLVAGAAVIGTAVVAAARAATNDKEIDERREALA